MRVSGESMRWRGRWEGFEEFQAELEFAVVSSVIPQREMPRGASPTDVALCSQSVTCHESG